MNDFKKNVKLVMTVFLIFFVGLISYIAYFQAFKAPDIASDGGNKRIWAKRNEVIRGTIYDRDGTALTSGERTGDLTQSRYYTQGDLYVHALGYIDNIYGLTGLEKLYDEELTSYSSVSTGLRSFFKDFSLDTLKQAFKERDESEEKIGNGVVTTLDTNIQKAAYNALGNNKGAVVVLNPKTGEVLAMVSKPTYNPNDLATSMAAANAGTSEDSPLINRATSGLYPPGSTFKIVTTASALENIKDVKTRIFEDRGKLVFNDTQSLQNSGGAVFGDIDLEQAFVNSSNVVYGTLAQELGNDKLKEMAERFGFNNSISAEGLTITKSSFPQIPSYEIGNIAQSGIGQSSIQATPMQMALVASTIANNGTMMEPKLVNKVIDYEGNTVKNISPKKYKDVIDSKNASTIKDYMSALVDKNVNNGSWYFFNGLDVAGKTGTATYLLANGQDAEPHSWFVGFAPKDDPQVAIAVIVENGGYGAGAAATVAGSVLQTAVK